MVSPWYQPHTLNLWLAKLFHVTFTPEMSSTITTIHLQSNSKILRIYRLRARLIHLRLSILVTKKSVQGIGFSSVLWVGFALLLYQRFLQWPDFQPSRSPYTCQEPGYRNSRARSPRFWTYRDGVSSDCCFRPLPTVWLALWMEHFLLITVYWKILRVCLSSNF